ncbi:MAG: D-alanyl-D-alanine carboxypeptidase [Lachnospiraceae bacterium]|nr:D-alanyl-D-alanine carboxypeptidase [Lachnospiraceae bacterium]
MKRLSGIVLAIAILAAIISPYSHIKAGGEWPNSSSAGSVSAASAIVMDINTGTILYEKNIDDKRYPASITKIMTTLLCIENANLSDTVTFSHHAVTSIEAGSSHLWVVTDEQIKMEDCLYGIMLMSANEMCNGVAEHVAGSIDAFVDMMNERAKEIGCTGTHFANPNGLYLDNHYTTAHDMALIATEAMKNPVFRKITGTKNYTIPKTNKNDARNLYNKHNMLHPISYPYGYDYCIGGKTGYTDIARWTLVTFAKKDDMELVCVVMKTNGPPRVEPNEYTDSTKLLDFAFDNYSYYPMQESLGDADAENGYSLFTNYSPLFDDDNSPLYIEENAGVVLPKGVKISKAERTTTLYDDVQIVSGKNVVGRVSYTYLGKEAGSADIIYDTTKMTENALNYNIAELLKQSIAEKEPAEKAEDKEKDTEDIKDDTAKKPEKEKKHLPTPVKIIIIAVVVVIVGFVAWVFIQRARLRKRYLGYYGRKRRYRRGGRGSRGRSSSYRNSYRSSYRRGSWRD